MNRRTFLGHTSRALAAAPFVSAAGLVGEARGQAIPAAAMNRLGVTTVVFRERFPATRTKGAPAPKEGDLTLLTAPKFIADTFGIHNVEIWNFQFADQSLDYCKQIRAAAEAVKSRIINIQVDGSENLSDPDPAKRADSVKIIKGWMDRAAACGATTCRANTGGGPAAGWDVNRTADSFRQLAQYGKSINVKILIENHIGYSADIDKVVALAKAVNDPFCRVISDWGNTPSSSEAARVEGLKKLLPYLELVSAKELDFNEQNKHVSYDIVPLVRATEASGYKGIYSIEFYSDKPPRDVNAAVKDAMQTIAANISRT